LRVDNPVLAYALLLIEDALGCPYSNRFKCMLNRAELEKRLTETSVGIFAPEDLRGWLVSVIAGDDLEFEDGDVGLVMSVVYLLESIKSNAQLKAMVYKILRILNATDSNGSAEALVSLVYFREAIESHLARRSAASAQVSDDTRAFLSSLRLRSCLDVILGDLDESTLRRIMSSLRSEDYQRVLADLA
jgi:hypothetical protein